LVSKQRVINQMSGGIDPLIEVGFLASPRHGQQVPEQAVYSPRKAGNINARARARQVLEKLKEGCDAHSGPGSDLSLFPREVWIGKRGFLPGAVSAQILQIWRESTREKCAQAGASVRGSNWTGIKLADFFDKVVHKHEEKLALRAKVLVEAADGKMCVPGDVADGRGLVTVRSEAFERDSFQVLALRETSFLEWRGWKMLTREQVGALYHD
jgi:hypothetical protein